MNPIVQAKAAARLGHHVEVVRHLTTDDRVVCVLHVDDFFVAAVSEEDAAEIDTFVENLQKPSLVIDVNGKSHSVRFARSGVSAAEIAKAISEQVPGVSAVKVSDSEISLMAPAHAPLNGNVIGALTIDPCGEPVALESRYEPDGDA